MDTLSSLLKLSESAQEVTDNFELVPTEIKLDFIPGVKIQTRLLSSKGSGRGKNKKQVVHALTEKSNRDYPYCGVKTSKAGWWESVDERVSCPKCLKIIEAQGLKQSYNGLG